MRSSFGRDSSDGYCVAFAQSLGHVLIAYTPVGLYAGSLSCPRLMPETSVIPAYSKFGDRNFAPSGQRRRRDLAEQRSARTRLSLRLTFRRIIVPFFLRKNGTKPHTIPQSAAQTAPFAQGSCGIGGEVRESTPPFLPPLMVRGGGAKRRRG